MRSSCVFEMKTLSLSSLESSLCLKERVTLLSPCFTQEAAQSMIAGQVVSTQNVQGDTSVCQDTLMSVTH